MRKKSTILIVDDNTAHRIMLKTLITKWGYDIVEADDGSTAIEKAKQHSFDFIIMDIRMVKVSGLEALSAIKAFDPEVPILIITAYASIETAISALKQGAYDYIVKPLDFDKLKRLIERATEHSRLKSENQRLKEQIESRFKRNKIIGNGERMERLLKTIKQVAPTEASVLILGESGVGKELIAEALHYNSHRNDKPYVKINCAAITETLLESELFGHEKGAFTGADRQKKGCFTQADGGSLFLDEISEMSLNMQVKLLRALQEREVTPVGAEKSVPFDVRIIAASNKDLPALIEQRLFREDLYYRFNVVELMIPPLRDRREDIPLLAVHFLEQFSEKNNKSIKGFTPEAMKVLTYRRWSGNVRELMNAVERAVVLTNSDYLETSSFTVAQSAIPEKETDSKIPLKADFDSELTLKELEKQAILKAIKASNGNKSEVARRLGITRKTLLKKLNAYDVSSSDLKDQKG